MSRNERGFRFVTSSFWNSWSFHQKKKTIRQNHVPKTFWQLQRCLFFTKGGYFPTQWNANVILPNIYKFHILSRTLLSTPAKIQSFLLWKIRRGLHWKSFTYIFKFGDQAPAGIAYEICSKQAVIWECMWRLACLWKGCNPIITVIQLDVRLTLQFFGLKKSLSQDYHETCKDTL